jgi:hypothetical protein
MQILGALVLLMQVVCAVHVVKTGRSFWWLWIILFLPGIGCLVYFIIELLPDVQRSRTAWRVGSDIVSFVDPGRSLRKLQDALEVADTFKNRQMLARGYVKAGSYPEAIDLYQRCLTGVFEDDPCIRLELAYAYFLHGSHGDALEILEQLKASHPGFRPPERDLLYARVLEELRQTDRALEAYAAMLKTSTGEETRCRYALLLEQVGQADRARGIFEEIVRRANRSPRYYRRAQKEWISLAKRHLSS